MGGVQAVERAATGQEAVTGGRVGRVGRVEGRGGGVAQVAEAAAGTEVWAVGDWEGEAEELVGWAVGGGWSRSCRHHSSTKCTRHSQPPQRSCRHWSTPMPASCGSLLQLAAPTSLRCQSWCKYSHRKMQRSSASQSWKSRPEPSDWFPCPFVASRLLRSQNWCKCRHLERGQPAWCRLHWRPQQPTPGCRRSCAESKWCRCPHWYIYSHHTHKPPACCHPLKLLSR